MKVKREPGRGRDRFLVDDGREAVVVKPVERSGATAKIKVILHNGREHYATAKVSERGARFLVNDDGRHREAVVAKPVDRSGAATKIKVILQNEIGVGVGALGKLRDRESQKGARFFVDDGREAVVVEPSSSSRSKGVAPTQKLK